MRFGWLAAGLLSAGMVVGRVQATEPNETFATATVAPAGVLVFSDTLTPGSPLPPNTFLGAADDGGFVYEVDDDSSIYGDGFASGLNVLDVNSGGSIDLAVTGSGDDFFFGDHNQFGAYTVHVDVYDSFGDFLESFTDERTLSAGFVDAFSYFDFNWSGGSYDVHLDNLTGATGGDVDFFKFNGLAPGATFTAQTADPTSSEVNTILGWFDADGSVLQIDDDGAGDLLSLISGVVPASGSLVFAVSGKGDVDLTGHHVQIGAYELRLMAALAGPSADFNSVGGVNAADLAIWKTGFGLAGSPTRAQGNADGDGDVDGGDFLIWQRQNGTAGLQGLAAAIPEPDALLLGACALTVPLAALGRRRRFSHRGPCQSAKCFRAAA